MGRGRRNLPVQMPRKLETIRTQLGFNLEEMIAAINKKMLVGGCPDVKIFRSHILEFEKGSREPQLPVLLAYAQIANIYVDVLINDDLEIPEKLPASQKKNFY